jgi:hypothetical protein
MGTKIPQGFRLDTDSFAEALRVINAFRPWVTAQSEALIDAFIEKADAAKKTPDADSWQLWQDLREKFVREKKRVMPAIDTDFSIALIPAEGVMLGVVYTVHRDWYEAWCKHPGVEEFYFVDSGDTPEDISEEAWAQRAQAWSVLNYDPVCMQGFSIDLVNPEGPLPKQYRVALKRQKA